MLINEFEIAENIMLTQKINNKNELFIIAKYLRNEINCDLDETIKMLSTILRKSDKNFSEAKSSKFIEKVAKKAKSYQLKKVENINITKSELDIIKQIESKKLQRLAFTLLVYAKYNNKVSSDNNDWCNIKISDLYRIARVSTKNAKEKGLFLNRLNKLGLISFSKKNTNLNCQCLFVDKSNSESQLVVSDLRELGYQYLKIYDDSQFTFCKNCGVVIKRKAKNDYSTKYCDDCWHSIRNDNLLNSFHKLD